MKKNISIIMLLAICCSVTLFSCATTTPVSVTASNTPLHDKIISENYGRVVGVGKPCYAILGIWMLGWPDIQSAIDSALEENKADALINIKCYESSYYFFFFSFSVVKIEGEAVKFRKITSDGANFEGGY